MYATAPNVCLLIRLALAAAILAAGAPAAFGERPTAAELLPQTTVAYVRIDNKLKLVEQLRNTAIGRVSSDPQIQPFVNQLYSSAAEAFRGIEGELGLSFDQLLAVPQGEICLALVAPERGQPALVALLEAGRQLPTARKFVASVQAKMEAGGELRTTETWQGTELTILESLGERSRRTVFFEQDETLAVVSNLELAKQLLSVWRGEESPTLADNRQFSAIMKRCSESSGEPPQVTYFFDPVGLVRSIASENMAVQMGIMVLEPLGLRGLQGIGGSLALGLEQFESLHHMHILIAPPRTGVLEILAPRSGDVTPELWVPNDAARYMTVHWDFQKSYAAMVAAYDLFRGEGGWANQVHGPLSDRLGANFENEVLPALEGRVTRVTWMQETSRPNGRATLIGVKLKDADAFRRTLDKMMGRGPNLSARRTFSGVSYYQFSPRSASRDSGGDTTRLPQSLVAILGDYLLLSDGEKLLERAIAAKKSDAPSLGEELDFKLIASKITHQAGGDEPSMISFERPEVVLRTSYELLRSEDTRRRLSEVSENNSLFRAVYEAMSKHPLPPFSDLEKYFAFGGGLLTNDETGIHSMGFTFRRD